MKLRTIIIPKKIAAAALVILIFTGLYQISESLAARRWKEQMFSPGLAGKTVVIDPGHGGADPGAVVGRVKEADLNMELARALKKQLEQKHVRVVLTRNGNTGLVPKEAMTYTERWIILEQRKKLALDRKGHILVSLHANSNKDPRVTGGMVFYSDGSSRELAECIENRLAEAGLKRRLVEHSNFTIISGNAMPSVLVEAGFITNKGERQRLADKKDLVAAAICRGIEDYTRELKPSQNQVNRGQAND